MGPTEWMTFGSWNPKVPSSSCQTANLDFEGVSSVHQRRKTVDLSRSSLPAPSSKPNFSLQSKSSTASRLTGSSFGTKILAAKCSGKEAAHLMAASSSLVRSSVSWIGMLNTYYVIWCRYSSRWDSTRVLRTRRRLDRRDWDFNQSWAALWHLWKLERWIWVRFRISQPSIFDIHSRFRTSNDLCFFG